MERNKKILYQKVNSNNCFFFVWLVFLSLKHIAKKNKKKTKQDKKKAVAIIQKLDFEGSSLYCDLLLSRTLIQGKTVDS